MISHANCLRWANIAEHGMIKVDQSICEQLQQQTVQRRLFAEQLLVLTITDFKRNEKMLALRM
jgi:hypothetical protein